MVTKGFSLMVKKMKSGEAWKLAGPDIFPPEDCPDAVKKFRALGPNRSWISLSQKVRKHLVSLGWKIECMDSESSDESRFRYTSPDGELFLSLREACEKLKQLSRKMKDGTNTFLGSQENNSDGTSFGSVDEPEYFPEAIVYWWHNGLDKKNMNDPRKSEMRSKAKKHLLALKWVFWYADKAGRQELRYTSPQGKVYYSLRMACKGCIEEGGVPASIVSAKNLSSRNVTIEAEESSVVPSQTESPARKRKKSDLAATTPQIRVDLGDETRSENVVGTVMNSRDDQNHAQPTAVQQSSQDDDDNGANFASLRTEKVLNTLMEVTDDQKPVQPTGVQQLRRRVRDVPPSVLSRLIENNVVLPMAKVYYRGKQGPLAEGCITYDGIKCNCCNKVFQLSAFEVHAGSKNHRPAANIFLEDGRSIVDCQRQVVACNKNKMTSASRKPRDSSKRKRHGVENYDICSVCRSGGELILCDHCPCGFHKDCIGLQSIPDGDWFCPSCCCGICGKGKFEHTAEHSVEDDMGRVCDQCEHRFHIGCIRRSRGVVKLKNFSQNKWFCSDRCECVFTSLHELLGKPISVGVDDLTWRLVKSIESDHPASNGSPHSEFLMEDRRKLNEALDVMHECFESVKDPLTGRDLVADVIFNRGSELKHLNFQGFYTVVLERNGEVISVATVRVFENIAEIPLVATRFKDRRNGMCRLMINELEKQLIPVGVERLVLPSAAGVLEAWTTKFGFSKMSDSERLNFLNYTFLDFYDTIMCQKHLMKELPEVSCKNVDVDTILQGETDLSSTEK